MEIGNVNDSKSYVMVKAMSKNYKNIKKILWIETLENIYDSAMENKQINRADFLFSVWFEVIKSSFQNTFFIRPPCVFSSVLIQF